MGFQSVEMAACRRDDDAMERCEPAKADLFTIYLRNEFGFAMAIRDILPANGALTFDTPAARWQAYDTAKNGAAILALHLDVELLPVEPMEKVVSHGHGALLELFETAGALAVAGFDLLEATRKQAADDMQAPLNGWRVEMLDELAAFGRCHMLSMFTAFTEQCEAEWQAMDEAAQDAAGAFDIDFVPAFLFRTLEHRYTVALERDSQLPVDDTPMRQQVDAVVNVTLDVDATAPTADLAGIVANVLQGRGGRTAEITALSVASVKEEAEIYGNNTPAA